MTESSGGSDHDPDFQSAEQWLAERGIRREHIRAGSSHDAPPPSVREARQLATEAPPEVPGDGTAVVDDDAVSRQAVDGEPPRPRMDLSDEVTRAMTFIQRSTASTPAATGRLRRKLADRGVPDPAIDIALEDAASKGLVDDAAYAAALVDEARASGHAPRRIRHDLRKRDFDDDVVAQALARINDRDPDALAFDVAQRQAASYRGLDAETAFRRLVSFLARRGHNEHVARKVARQVVFDDRSDDRIAGH